jgi:hypothetical protein
MRTDALGTLSNRELAALVWVVFLVLLCVAVPKLRRSIGPAFADVVKSFFAWRVQIVFGLFLVYAAVVIFGASKVDIWELSMTKDSALIVLGAGFPLLLHAVIKIQSGGELARHFVLETVGVTALVIYIAGLASFSLVVELVLLPVSVFFAALGAFAGRQANGKAAAVLSSVILASIGLSAVTWSITQLFSDQNSDITKLLQAFALTVWLPLATLPFIYVTAFMAEFGRVLALVRASSGTRPSLQVRLALFIGFRGRLKTVKSFHPYRRCVRGDTPFREVLSAVRRGTTD